MVIGMLDHEAMSFLRFPVQVHLSFLEKFSPRMMRNFLSEIDEFMGHMLKENVDFFQANLK